MRNAEVAPSATALRVLPSRRGLSIRASELAQAISRRYLRPGAARVLPVPTEIVEPAVTTAQLRERQPTFITISRSRFELRVFERLRLAKRYRISIGRIGYETPAGLYRIRNKAVDPAWYVPNRPWAGELAGKVIPPGPGNPIAARWLGINDGVGIHGTAETWSIGRRASHGCIRMTIADVVELYARVPRGTPVYIG